MKIGVLVSHHSHVEWARQRWPDCILIAIEYITIQLHSKESLSYFYPDGDEGINWESTVNQLSDYWYRDEEGLDLVSHEGFSVAQVLTGSMRIGLATQIRDYEAVKYWCSNRILLNEPLIIGSTRLNIMNHQTAFFRSHHLQIPEALTITSHQLKMDYFNSS